MNRRWDSGHLFMLRTGTLTSVISRASERERERERQGEFCVL